jgi:regulator of protease activity HflC (stomatin/prohibitin superfamily)
METIFYYAMLPGICIIIVAMNGFYTVNQHNAIVIERFGKFRAVKKAGLHFKLPFIDKIAETYCLRVQQLDIVTESKTRESFFVDVTISVQYKIIQDKVFEAYNVYKPHQKITAYINDALRTEIPKLSLTEAFERKDRLAEHLKMVLSENMNQHGFEIINVLTTDIEPDMHVKNIMNTVNVADLKKSAVAFEAELFRIMAIAKAEAEAEKKKLEGRGYAKHQLEVAKGFIESLEALTKAGITTPEASALLFNNVTQANENESKPSQNTNVKTIDSILASYKKEDANHTKDEGYKVVDFGKLQDSVTINAYNI